MLTNSFLMKSAENNSLSSIYNIVTDFVWYFILILVIHICKNPICRLNYGRERIPYLMGNLGLLC
jgi:hypothetical protein